MRQEDDLRSLIGYQLKGLQSVLRARMDEELRPLGLGTPQYVCLELLSRTPDASSSDLARGAFVTRQTMSTLLRTLMDNGLVQRAERAPSGRALPIRLTAEGRHRLEQASAVVGRIEQTMISPLDEEQRRMLHEALTQCIDALSTPTVGHPADQES